MNFGDVRRPGHVASGPGLRQRALPACEQRLLRLLESTSYAYNPAAAFSLRLDSGLLFAAMKGGVYVDGYVWPVRSGSLGPNPLPTDTATPTPTSSPTPTATPTPVRPVITDVTPGEVKAGVAGSVQIAGRSFQPGAMARLGSGPAPQHHIRRAKVSCSPMFRRCSAGQYDMSIVNPDGRAGTKSGAYRILGPTVADLYGYDYELKPARQVEAVGAGTFLYFVVHRLGGSAPWPTCVWPSTWAIRRPVASSWVRQDRQPAPNGFFGTYIAWTPTLVGYLDIYAVIDPANQVAEGDESNNTYRSWVEVRAAAAQDKTLPVVDRVGTG